MIETREGRIYRVDSPGVAAESVRISNALQAIGNTRPGDYKIEVLRPVGWIVLGTVPSAESRGGTIATDTEAVAIARSILGRNEA